MGNIDLGSLEKVDLRDIWGNEPKDFTPWLAQEENLKRLGTAIGIELELEAQEKDVGPFRADILCRDVMYDNWVLIENQLENTDHIHMGQLITYAAGLDAVTIIWIARQFNEQHRAALDWLNEKTPDDIAFFGLEIELWKIGDSKKAPKFNIVSRPNEWTRSLARVIHGQSRYFPSADEYWQGIIDALKPKDILNAVPNPTRKHDMAFPVGWKDAWLKSYFSKQSNNAGIWVACRGEDRASQYQALLDKRKEIEDAFGEELSWSTDDQSISYVMGDKDPINRKTWPELHPLIADNLERLFHAVNPIFASLK